MRSRYSAFALADAAYLERTWHTSTRPHDFELDRSTWWTRLEILDCTGGGPFHTEGTVEFRAYYRDGADRAGVERSMRENSAFVREGGDWVYLAAV